jgi:ubiquitin fusion degradation protein 1
MPPSALDQLTRLNIEYPMLFKITNRKDDRHTHAGVLEFIADEGKIYIPFWMMRNLLLEEGDLITIENVSLPVATYSKFQPQSVDFLDITNPKAVLENCLRNFACLTTGDLLAINYNNRIYELCVLETKPGRAVTIIECDMNVEFAAPVGYKEPVMKRQPEEDQMEVDPTQFINKDDLFYTFKGEGTRLDGKKIKEPASNDPPAHILNSYVRGVPDYDHNIFELKFDRSSRPKAAVKDGKEQDEFKKFQGEGNCLRSKKQ